MRPRYITSLSITFPVFVCILLLIVLKTIMPGSSSTSTISVKVLLGSQMSLSEGGFLEVGDNCSFGMQKLAHFMRRVWREERHDMWVEDPE
jgi:hypothetical protein